MDDKSINNAINSSIVSPNSCPSSPASSVPIISAPFNLLASGTAAIVSTFCVQPLELIKTRLQVSQIVKNQHDKFCGITGHFRTLMEKEGVRGLYRGVFPSLISFVPSISIYFTLYNEFKRFVGCPAAHAGSYRAPEDAVKALCLQSVSAGLASNCTAAITNPLWLVKTRLQTQAHTGAKYKHSFHAFQSIIREEGVRGLYKGLTASFLASTQAMIQFPLYEGLKCLLCENHSNSSHLAAGAIASSLSCTLTYPSEVVRSRLQVQGATKKIKYNGVWHALKTIWKEEGVRGLYRGWTANIMRITPAHAIALTVYELILRVHTKWA